jgi:dTDP-4-dehydrorhamnose reductase
MKLWAGIECTLNRVGNGQRDQLALTGHYNRPDDLERLAALGVRTVRYPVLWECVASRMREAQPWAWHDTQLARLRALDVEPIIGLVHHGSGPLHTDLLDDAFAGELASFARDVAQRYPWVQRFTPINEPLTTARFSALYGHWYPHERNETAFVKAELNQVRAVRLAMEAIREVTPSATLVQTEDLGKTHATTALEYQASFENERRWFTFDLLLARVVPGHRMFDHACSVGIRPGEIARAAGDGCVPEVVGINHYVTSERWLDEDLARYPESCHGGNGRHRYADVEAVRALPAGGAGLEALLVEASDRYHLPIAITEVHLGCTREQQLRWLRDAWHAAHQARARGADVLAVTAWAAFGTQDWSSLVIRVDGAYESGLFDVRGPSPRATALARMAGSLATTGRFDHPVLDESGWWKRPHRLVYHAERPPADRGHHDGRRRPPRRVLITGAAGTLGTAFTRICRDRGLAVHALARHELDIRDADSVRRVLREDRIWAVVNAAGYVRVDDAESDRTRCHDENVAGVSVLAAACDREGVRLLTFSSDLVFNGAKESPYVESERCAPLCVYGESKAAMERLLIGKSGALIIRSAAFFGLWDDANFVTRALRMLQQGRPFRAADDVIVSPTFVPDLAHAALDLLIDGEHGIWHLANAGALSWADFARHVASAAGLDASLIQACPHVELGGAAPRPNYSALASERATIMPTLENALERYARERPWLRAIQSLFDTGDATHAAHSRVG